MEPTWGRAGWTDRPRRHTLREGYFHTCFSQRALAAVPPGTPQPWISGQLGRYRGALNQICLARVKLSVGFLVCASLSGHEWWRSTSCSSPFQRAADLSAVRGTHALRPASSMQHWVRVLPEGARSLEPIPCASLVPVSLERPQALESTFGSRWCTRCW